MVRYYRQDLRKNGMTSPPELANYPVYVIANLHNELLQRPLSVLDVGCGSGAQMRRITETVGDQFFSRRVGIDWSQRAVELLQEQRIYDSVVHAQSSVLPFANREFDVAISMENIEHLYSDQIIPAISELCRVASYVIITTPRPEDCINQEWLSKEIPEAELDTDPMDYSDWLLLEGAAHKSIINPESMLEAGFSWDYPLHGKYFGISDNVDVSKIRYSALAQEPLPDTDDYRQHYIKLLKDSLKL